MGEKYTAGQMNLEKDGSGIGTLSMNRLAIKLQRTGYIRGKKSQWSTQQRRKAVECGHFIYGLILHPLVLNVTERPALIQ